MNEPATAPVTDRTLVTRAAEGIHNPADARHWMRARPVKRRVTLRVGDQVVARSTRALRIIELGKDAYEPALYLPREDVLVPLEPASKDATFCPLKGHASYFDLVLPDETLPGAVWTYHELFDFARVLEGRVAFYLDRIIVEEAPLDA